MKNNKKILFISIGIVFLLIILLSIVFSFMDKKNNMQNENIAELPVAPIENKETEISVYYLDTVTNKLVFENRKLKLKEKATNLDELSSNVQIIFDSMKQNTKLHNAVSVIPENLKIISAEIKEDNLLKLDFSKEYYELDEIKQIFLRSGIVWTMTELPYIKNVAIYIEGKPITKGNGEIMGMLNRENIILNPTISPEKIELEEVVLYFSDEEELKLVPEIREIQAKQSQSLETQIVEQLILGPKKEGHFQTVPPETKIRNIKTEGGICYVDLSNEFISKHTGGSTAEIFTIYSIVNSLTEVKDVKKVQFLIDGEKVATYKGSLDISKPLAKKEF